MVALLSTASLVVAQEKPASPPSAAAQAAEKRANEWSTLALNLDQRMARLLPCDARVRSAIDEVARASEARFAALIAYWQEAAKLSKDQEDAARLRIAENGTRRADGKADRTDSEQERTQIDAQTSDLRESARQQAALANAARLLNGISQNAAAVTKLAAEREDAFANLDASLNDVIAAAESRQTAIENELKAIATERTRWSEYYVARVARAQMECSITRPSGAPNPAPAPRPQRGTSK